MNEAIKSALKTYDQSKGFWRRIFGDAPAIKALRRLSSAGQNDLLKVYQCFLDAPSALSQASYKVYQAVIKQLDAQKTIKWLQMFEDALATYDKNKGFFRRLFGDAPAIRAIRQLSARDRVNPAKIAQCFVEHDPTSEGQASSAVFMNFSVSLLNFEVDEFTSYDYVLYDYYRGLLSKLSKANLLTQENLGLIAQHEESHNLVKAFVMLNKKGLLTPANKQLIVQQSEPCKLANAFVMLNKEGLLTFENKSLITLHYGYRNSNFDIAFRELSKANLLTQENLGLIAQHEESCNLVKAFVRLNEEGLLTLANKQLIVRQREPCKLANAFLMLNKEGLLTLENKLFITQYWACRNFDTAIRRLSVTGLLTQEKLGLIAQHEDPARLAGVLSTLAKADLLTQENFDQLLHHDHDYLTSHDAIGDVWNRLPRHLLTQPAFDRLLESARADDPAASARLYIYRLLGLREVNNAREVEVNAPQSTHTASVHKSVSISAIKLLQRYGSQLQAAFSSIVDTVAQFIDSASNSPQQKEAAQRAATRIIDNGDAFKDPESEVSNKQLLALSYLAVHDEANRAGVLEDAQKQVVEGLYEIQRGYNLSATGVDDGRQDRPICTAGTFNKMMEKLQGIHPDVEIVFVDKGLASKKLQVVSLEEAQKHLEQQADASLIDQVKEEGSLEPIWAAIKPAVLDRMYDEFHTLFPKGREGDFEDFAGNGLWVALSDEDANKIKSTIEKVSAIQPNGSSSQGFFAPSAHEEFEQEKPPALRR